MNRVFIYIFLFFCSISFAQNSINSYKYILVPKQFEFQKSQDKYQFNSLTKFLFDKEGFNVLYTDDVYPTDLANNGCLGLKVRVNNNSSLFKTKMNIDLLDCFNKVVFSSKDGNSRIKEYKKAYHEALRDAFMDIKQLDYKYVVSIINDDQKEVIDKKKVDKKDQIVEETELKILKSKNDIRSTSLKSIEGKFNFENWGKVVISKKEDYFSVVGGDENFQFATIYKTSKLSIFIIKWASFKQPELLEIDLDGNLKVDSKEGVKLFKRIL
jgi:hypothetical protein